MPSHAPPVCTGVLAIGVKWAPDVSVAPSGVDPPAKRLVSAPSMGPAKVSALGKELRVEGVLGATAKAAVGDPGGCCRVPPLLFLLVLLSPVWQLKAGEAVVDAMVNLSLAQVPSAGVTCTINWPDSASISTL